MRRRDVLKDGVELEEIETVHVPVRQRVGWVHQAPEVGYKVWIKHMAFILNRLIGSLLPKSESRA